MACHARRGCNRVNRRSIEERHGAILFGYQQHDLGASEDDSLCPTLDQARDDGPISLPGFGIDLADHKFLVDDFMHHLPVFGAGYDHFKIMASLQTAPVEILLHGEGRAEQANAPDARSLDPPRCRIGNVQERNAHSLRNRIRQPMHRIGAQHDEVSPSPLQVMSGVPHHVCKPVPFACMLELLDFLEIDGPHEATRRMHAAQALQHFLIDDAVILG
jgi:hypothetical protein